MTWTLGQINALNSVFKNFSRYRNDMINDRCKFTSSRSTHEYPSSSTLYPRSQSQWKLPSSFTHIPSHWWSPLRHSFTSRQFVWSRISSKPEETVMCNRKLWSAICSVRDVVYYRYSSRLRVVSCDPNFYDSFLLVERFTSDFMNPVWVTIVTTLIFIDKRSLNGTNYHPMY